MKIEIVNPNNIVSSAFIANDTELSFSVFINTTERWVQPYGITFGNSDITFEFADSEGFDDGGLRDLPADTVTVFAESDEECNELKRLYFTLHDKDQLWYLFPKAEVYTK